MCVERLSPSTFRFWCAPCTIQQSSESLELKALHERRALCKGAGPGTVEIFEKTILGRSATLADIVRRCGSGHGGKVSSELEAALRDPVEVHVAKTVRKKALDAGRALVSFEVTGRSSQRVSPPIRSILRNKHVEVRNLSYKKRVGDLLGARLNTGTRRSRHTKVQFSPPRGPYPETWTYFSVEGQRDVVRCCHVCLILEHC